MLNLFNQNADIESAIDEALSANPNKKAVVKDASKALGKAVSNGLLIGFAIVGAISMTADVIRKIQTKN